MSAKEFVKELNGKGVRLFVERDRIGYECMISPLAADDLKKLVSMKDPVMGFLYGINEIKKNELIYTPSGFAKVVEASEKFCAVSGRLEKDDQYVSYAIWEINPVVSIEALDLNKILPLDQKRWSDFLVSGLEPVMGHWKSLDAKQRASKSKHVALMSEYLDCNWEQLSHWQFKIRVENYLNAHF